MIIKSEGGTIMKCFKCASEMEQSFTTDVTDLGSCLVIVRNVPCFKCTECSEVFYTGAVIKQLEKIVESAKNMSTEIAVIDFNKQAA